MEIHDELRITEAIWLKLNCISVRGNTYMPDMLKSSVKLQLRFIIWLTYTSDPAFFFTLEKNVRPIFAWSKSAQRWIHTEMCIWSRDHDTKILHFYFIILASQNVHAILF